jgi:multidrug resistance protein, MATE family
VATVTANITCYTPIQGLVTSLDTLCPQAFGSGYKSLVGLHVQRMICLLWVLLIPLAIIWYNADLILTTVIPETETALLAAHYLHLLILGTPGFAAFEAGKRFFQAQGLFHATTTVLYIAVPFNVFMNWLLVFKLNLGFSGAPIAVSLTQLLLPFLLWGYLHFVGGRQYWDGFKPQVFANWGTYITN